MLSAISAACDGGQDSDRIRQSSYDELYVVNAMSKKYPGVDGGEYRTATMLPGATALQHGILAAFDATKACIAFQNSSAAASPSRRCYLDYIRFIVVTAPTSATLWNVTTVIDDKDRTPTTISSGTGGSGPGTPATATAYKSPAFDPNMDNGSPAIVGVPYFPISTAAGLPPAVPAAGANARTIVGNLPLRAQIPVAGDEYLIDFGSGDLATGSALATAAPAGASRIVSSHPGIVLGPKHWFLLHMWGTGNVTAGIAFSGLDMGWWER